MNMRVERPESASRPESPKSAPNGSSGPEAPPERPAERERPADREEQVEERVERESVHLERAAASPSQASPEAAPAPTTPRWSQARRVPERSDVVVDASHLTVDELSVELEGDMGIKHLRLETKGLEAQLFLKADLENVVALVDSAGRRTPPIVESARRREDGAGDPARGGKLAAGAGTAVAGLAAGGALLKAVGAVRGGPMRRSMDRVRGRGALASALRRLT
jgi:hypothetical protein